jgi:hypothetical protein
MTKFNDDIKSPDNINWYNMSRHPNLSIEFIEKYIDYMDWDNINKIQHDIKGELDIEYNLLS